MRDLPEELLKASRFRVTEEVFRILTQKHRDVGFRLMCDYGLMEVLYPQWLQAIGDEGLDQVEHFFEMVESAATQGKFLPLEVVAAGLFLPLLDHIDVHQDQYQDKERGTHRRGPSAGYCDGLTEKTHEHGGVVAARPAVFIILCSPHQQCRKICPQSDIRLGIPLHDLAFGHLKALHPLQEHWLTQRENLGHELGGWADSPDQRDIFSFRGQTGGGRHDGHPASPMYDGLGGHDDQADRRPRRGSRRRGGRRRGQRHPRHH